MVKVEVKLGGTHPFSSYGVVDSGKDGKWVEAWIFQSKAKDGKWADEYDRGLEGEWKIAIVKTHPALEGIKVEYSWYDGEYNEKQHDYTYELEFDDNVGLTRKMGSSKPPNPKIRVFQDDDKIIRVIKKGGKDNNDNQEREREREREREQNQRTTRTNCWIGGYN